MQYLNTLINLLAATESRDKILRLVQYLTLFTQDDAVKGPTYNVYSQMRRTRKILRFLRTLQYSTAIRKDIGALVKTKSPFHLTLKIITILQNLCTLLFFIFDHRVVLGQIDLIAKENVAKFYPKSMKMYLCQNIFGALRCLVQIFIIITEGAYNGQLIDMEKGTKILIGRAIEFIKNILDIFVAKYLISKPKGSAAKIGVIGVITSLIGIAQSLKIV